MMAARTGKIDAVKVLLDHGAQVNAKETWGGTTALMWAVSERHPDVVKMLDRTRRGRERQIVLCSVGLGPGIRRHHAGAAKPNQPIEEFASGMLTPLMFAAREDDLESAQLLVKAGRRCQRAGRRRQRRLVAGAVRRQLRRGGFPGRQPRQCESERRAAIHAAVLGGGPAEHGNRAELPLDGDQRSASADQEAAGCRGGPERCHQLHSAGPHARGIAAHRVRDGNHARGVLRAISNW